MKPPRVEVKGEPSFLSGPGPFGTHAFMHCTLRRDGSIEVVTLRAERGKVDGRKEVTSRTKPAPRRRSSSGGCALLHACPGGYVARRMLDAREKVAGGARPPVGGHMVSAMAWLYEAGPHSLTASTARRVRGPRT
ncbi:MAG: hypothetical protein R3A52_21735 [Polyangiales bacterium]